MVSLLQRAVPEERQEAVIDVLEQMEAFHPKEPHWYLAMIGVDPMQQNKGYGSAMLKESLKRCDDDNLPAYLESSNPRNIPLYERHGFETIGRIQSGESPVMVPMLRRPGQS